MQRVSSYAEALSSLAMDLIYASLQIHFQARSKTDILLANACACTSGNMLDFSFSPFALYAPSSHIELLIQCILNAQKADQLNIDKVHRFIKQKMIHV